MSLELDTEAIFCSVNMSKKIYFINFLPLIFTFALGLDDPVVTTKYGTIIGSNVNISEGKVIHFFTGIPFAKPPVGKLRFEVSRSFKNL